MRLRLLIASLVSHAAAFGQAQSLAVVHGEIVKKFDRIVSVHISESRAEDGPEGHRLVSDLRLWASGRILVDGGHEYATGDWRTFDSRTQTHIHGFDWEVLWPNRRMYERGTLSGSFRHERVTAQLWLRASGFWPTKTNVAVPTVFGVRVDLLSALRSRDYRVEEHLDFCIDGSCVLLRGPGDVIWLDPSHGFAIRRRCIAWNDVPAAELLVTELVELPGVIWMPKRYTYTVFLDDVGQPLPHPLVLDVDVAFTRLNSLIENDVRLELPPGTIRMDRRAAAQVEQIVPGGIDFLVAAGRSVHQAFVPPDPSRSWIAGLLGVVVAGFVGIIRREKQCREK